jgi:hypothetical protein
MKMWLRGLRFSIAILLLVTSLGKLLDVRGFADVLVTFDLFPGGTEFAFALGLSLFELFLSLWMFSGLKLAYSALAATGLHVQFTALAAISNVRDLDIPNCGCFGIFWARPMSWGKVVEDAVLTAMCIALFLLARRLQGGRPDA